MIRLAAHRFGTPDQVLTLEEAQMPCAAPGTAIVRMLASPVNPSDLIPITGAYAQRTSLPFVPGFEGVGVVGDVGDGADRTLLGRRVLPLGSAGCWQTHKALPADWCVPVPDELTDEAAAVAFINPLTALLMVRQIAPRPGDVVGITAAASAIGRMLIRMVAAAGARPVAIVRSLSSLADLRNEPCEGVLDGAMLPLFSAGLDPVGGFSGEQLAAAIVPGGELLHYGLLSGQPLRSAARARLTLFRLRDAVHSMPRSRLHALMMECFSEVLAGRAACPILASYPLDAYREALSENSRRERRGKILFRP